MRTLRLLPCVVWAFIALPCLSQTFQVPSWIHGRSVDRNAGLHSLGFDRETAALHATDSARIEWHALYGKPPGILLFLPCGASQVAIVGLLRWQNGWVLTDKVSISCRAGSHPRIALLSLAPNARETLAIHNEEGGHGTGYVERHFALYEIAADKLSERFVTLEYMRSERDGVAVEERRHLIPVSKSGRVVTLQDTCTVVRMGRGDRKRHRDIFRRKIRWSAAEQKFEATTFHPLGASQGTCEPSETGIL